MTKHNIGEHLSWLLVSNSSKPSQLGPPIIDTETSFSSGTVPIEDFGESLLEPGVSGPTESSNNVYPSDRNSRSKSQNPLPSQTSVTKQNIETMARLQSGPKSVNKPKLLSQARADLLQTPKTYGDPDFNSSLRDRYCAPYAQDPSGKCL